MREIWQICESREKDVARIVSPGRNLPAFSLLSEISKLQYREFRARRLPRHLMHAGYLLKVKVYLNHSLFKVNSST